MKYDRALSMAEKKGGPTQAVFALLVEADQEGDFRATFALATWYLFGTLFTKKNEKKAVQMLRVAAKNNVADAAYHLGIAYERGVGIRKSLKLAFFSYTHAALLGNAEAHFAVGKMYYHGLGTPRNRTLAKYWLDKAEVLGVVE